jgi:hypothetical protein
LIVIKVVNQLAVLPEAALVAATEEAAASGPVEGVDILSTGESGTKFLGINGDGTSSWQVLTGGGDALVANPLSQFAATTLAQLNATVSDATLIDTTDSRLTDARTPTTHVHEGTQIASTGEAGATKFLREDGDGTCSWQSVPSGSGDLKADGTVPLTANWDLGSFILTALRFTSDVATGTAPLTVASTTVVANLNASFLEGNAASAFALAAHTHEGTAILSTGEVGGTKFLREDGDGTCSWQTIAGGGDALTSNPLSQFAATTLAQLNGVVSDATLIDTGDSRLSDARTPTAHVHAWADITSGKPTTLSGYGILDTKANFNIALSDGSFLFVGDAPTSHVHAWADITSGKPTTLAGYGISDTKANFNTALSDGSFMFVGDAPTAHAHEGTAILSTGEIGGTKFLREDGDGTCSWQTVAGGSSPLTTKGDVYTYSTVDARLPVGTDGQVLSADSAETTGLKWIAAGGGGGWDVNDDIDSNYGQGVGTLDSVTSGKYNTAIGVNAGTAVTSGQSNFLVGKDAGDNISTGINNVAIGEEALSFLSSGAGCIGIGYWALRYCSGTSNVAIGQSVMSASGNSGGHNTIVGNSSAPNHKGDYCTFYGERSGYNSGSADYSIALGYDSPLALTSGVGWLTIGCIASSATAFVKGRMCPYYSDIDVSGEEIVITGTSAYWLASTNQNGGNLTLQGGQKANGGGLNGKVKVSDVLNIAAVYTVSALPTGAVGDMCRVSDGTASLAFGATVTGSGSTPYLVWYNGTNWTVMGA